MDVLFFASSHTVTAFTGLAPSAPFKNDYSAKLLSIRYIYSCAMLAQAVMKFGFCTSSKVHYVRLTACYFVCFSRALKPDLSVVPTSRDVTSGRWSAGWFWSELSLLWLTSII
jgi:hypothetical protein